jgi:acetyl-CoA carboxylase biotin carboxylase subunit
MICKLITYRQSRGEAIETMKRALGEFIIEPLKTTIPACLDIMNHNMFVKGTVDTGFIERNF